MVVGVGGVAVGLALLVAVVACWVVVVIVSVLVFSEDDRNLLRPLF